MELETKRFARTLDLDLIDAASRRDPKAFEDLGYHSNGEWPGTDFMRHCLFPGVVGQE